MGQSSSRPPQAPSRRRSVINSVKRRSSQILRRRNRRNEETDPKPLEALPVVDDDSEPAEPQEGHQDLSSQQHEINQSPVDQDHSSEQPAVESNSPHQAPEIQQPAYSPSAGPLVVVQGVVHTSQDSNEQQDASDSPSNAPDPSPPQAVPSSFADQEMETDIPINESSPPPPADPSRSLSSSSIDVLGTLLSVAAAATAASLLTGSSEPILASGLSPPPPSPSQDPNSRMRQAWGSIRDRLGMRPSSPASPSPPSIPVSPPSPSQPPSSPDARHLMLADMARAFSMGASSRDHEDDGLHSPPAEGSFERFLFDLQTDLRSALAGIADEAPNTNTDPQQPVNEPEPIDPPQQSEANCPLPMMNSSMPSLASVSSSSGASNDSSDLSASGSSHESSSASTSSPNPQAQSSVTTASRNRVNWWRMYRFPAVSTPPRTSPPSNLPSTGIPLAGVPQMGLAAPGTPTLIPNQDPSSAEEANDSPPTNPSGTVVPVIVVGLQSVISRGRDALSPSTPTLSNPSRSNSPQPSNVVAPSTSTLPTSSDSHIVQHQHDSWPSRAATALRNSLGRSSPHSSSSAEGPVEPNGSITPPLEETSVADSMPAAEPEDHEQQNRTFLIYVIGGYYPPNHSIVTSGLGAGNLDSFEALLEIAELLGHGKNPTASKEEIEKSGLEVVPAHELSQQKDVMPSCLERCLICLEDYEASDSVRIMQCNHAFHKDCVDTWLETGRNNCPACRSQGVSTSASMHPTA